MKILRLIDCGRDRMDYIIDAIAVDTASLSTDIEYLEREGYINRKGATLSDFYSFVLLDRGAATVPPKRQAEQRLAGDNLTPDDLNVLRFLQGRAPAVIEAIAAATGLPETDLLSSLNYHVDRTGYLAESGFFRRKVALSPQGELVLQKHREFAAV